MELIIIFVIAYFIIKVVTKGDSSPSSSNSTISKADTGEYISLDEYDKIPRNNLADKKFASEQLVGTIKSFDNSQKTGIIVSNNYTYEIIFQRNFNYDSFPNHMPKVNDIVVFQPQAINEKLFASNIEYYQSDMIINNTSSSTASTTNTSSTLLEEARNKQKLKCPMLSEPTKNTPYYALLKKYRSKYKEQVFQRKYLSEIQALIGFQRELSEIKSDLKHVRNGIGITANPTVRAIQNEEKSKTQPVQEQSQTINTTPPQSIKRSNPYRILICDNAAFMRMMLKDILTKNGYEVIAEAQDGLEATERYYEFKPDLVFMEINMPKMNGIDAMKKIKKRDSHANIVICSTMGQQELIEEAIRSGAKDFIVKPFSPERILETIAKIFEPRRTATPPKETEQSQAVNTTPPVETEQSQTVSTIPPEETGQSQAAIQTPPVQEQSKQNQNVSNALAENNESFYSYVTHMSNTQLINMIDGQYKAIKGTWTLAPCMGTYGSIEFAAVLLLWKYAVNNFNRNQKAYASLQVTLGDMIGCSFFGMPAKEWSDKMDPIINTHADILSYEEFGDVYNYLKDKLVDKIHSMEFNKGNAKEAEYRQIYEEFTRMYNSVDGFPEIFDFYMSKGLNLEKDIQSLNESAIASLISQKWEWGEKDFMKAVKSFLLLQEWELHSGNIVNAAEIGGPVVLSDNLTDNFYISTYQCPTCGRRMYKTEFPIGCLIKIGEDNVIIKRIFTCDRCKVFYAPLPGHKLSYGQCYCLESRTQYDLLLKIFDRQGTTDGRPDA